jgi:Dolichyl-phosphate-mannose-protein mannosyltransferase
LNQVHLTTITPETAEGLPKERASTPAAGHVLASSFLRAWRWWLPPAVLAFLLVLAFVDPFIGDWDGLDYTMLSLAGYPSSMALGRNLFIFGNHALYQLAHYLFTVPPESAYLIFKYAVVAQAPLAIVACWVLARDVSVSLYSATLAALMVALSPVFVLYSGQVMTDVPSVLLLAIALILHLRGVQEDRPLLILVGAALLGLGVNLRETIGFYVPWLVLAPVFLGKKFGRRELLLIIFSCCIFLVCALGWFSYWFITDPHYRRIWFGWRESMAQESARHPVTFKNLWPYLMYFFISAPVAFLVLPFAIVSERRRNRTSPLLLLGLVGLFADLLLFLNYSTAVNWRYFLTGLPAIAPLSADFFIRKLSAKFGNPRAAFAACVVTVLAFATMFGIVAKPVSREFVERRALSKEYKYRLQNVPRDAVMISGAQTIAVSYWKAMGVGDWKTIGTGGGWPQEGLGNAIQARFNSGERVFLDTDPRWWIPCSWQKDEITSIVKLEEHFKFRRVTDTIYEVRPSEDRTANDKPNLTQLLPENRPADTKKCAPGRA